MDDSVDWSHEWLTSLLWTAQVSAYTVVGFVVVALLLMRLTRWGRQFRALTLGYFIPGRTWKSWRPLLLITVIIVLNVFDVRIAVINSYAQNFTATAVQNLDAPHFWHYTGIGALVSGVFLVNYSTRFFAQQAFSIYWRVWLNDRTVDDWLDGQAYHRGRFVGTGADNPDQRIQQDVGSFVDDSATLAFDTTNQVTSMWSFTIILWGLSGPMPLFGITIPRAMTFLIFAYVLVTSVLAFRIGRPLIRLNFLSERFNASFRYALVRLRDNSENVAFHRGENAERTTLSTRFAAVIANTWRLILRLTGLNGFNQLLDQISIILPFVLQASRLFSGAIKLGDVVQTGTAMGKVHDALSYFRNTYKSFAEYRATIERLSGLHEANAQARRLPVAKLEQRAGGLEIHHLTVSLPNGRPLITDLDLTLRTGESLLVKGPSGTGKTTLLRSMAGLWPYVEGSLARPTGPRAIFLAQQPYLPLGALRATLAYPGPADELDDPRAIEVLRQVQLAHLVEALDLNTDWSHTLSPGEQQRIGFARVLLARPAIAFLDESTSALDEGIEHMLYDVLAARLPECTLVSVGHRATLDRLHTHQLQLRADASWALTAPANR